MERFDTMERRLLVYAAVVLTFIAYTLKPSWFEFTNIMTALSAIGTVGAVWFALYESLRTRRESEKRALGAATLRAAGLYPQLDLAVHTLMQAVSQYHGSPLLVLHGITLEESRERDREQRVAAVIEACRNPAFFQTPETFANLLSVPNDGAIRWYRASVQLHNVLTDHDVYGFSVDLPGLNPDIKPDYWVKAITQALEDLIAAKAGLAELARKVAPGAPEKPGGHLQ